MITDDDCREEEPEDDDDSIDYDPHIGCPNWPCCDIIGCGPKGDDPPGHRG